MQDPRSPNLAKVAGEFAGIQTMSRGPRSMRIVRLEGLQSTPWPDA